MTWLNGAVGRKSSIRKLSNIKTDDAIDDVFRNKSINNTLHSDSTYKTNTEYIPRVKFQQRGSPHIHTLFWVSCRIWELPVLLHHYLL